jgi:hypothetical protein
MKMQTMTWNLVAQLEVPGRRACLRFTGVPVDVPVHIAIVSDHSVSASSDAQALFDALIDELRALTTGMQPPVACDGPVGSGCMARKEPRCQSVLVAVGDGVTQFPQSDLLANWISSRPDRSVVLPVLPAGSAPQQVLPAAVATLQTLFVRGPIVGALPDVLRSASIGRRHYRLFISYRRADAQALADQLHDEFTHVGFRVYLDRFHGSVGRAFPRQIAEELVDAGCVLLLESASILSSPWTLAEVAFARLYRLGLVAIEMPKGVRLGAIGPKDRLSFNTGWNSGSQVTLTAPRAQEVVSFVRSRYAGQTLRRRAYLESALAQALLQKGVTSTAGQAGIVLAQSQSASPLRRYALLMSALPPAIDEMRRISSHPAQLERRIVIGPHGLSDPERKGDAAWLAKKLDVVIESEWNLRSLAE